MSEVPLYPEGYGEWGRVGGGLFNLADTLALQVLFFILHPPRPIQGLWFGVWGLGVTWVPRI